MNSQDLSPEIWYLIFQALPTRNDLINACQVCKSFDALATPLLYRSAILGRSPSIGADWYKLPSDAKDPERAEELSFGLFQRLLDDRNEKLRGFVRELTLKGVPITGDVASASRKLEQPQDRLQDRLTALVKKLPNLEVIYFKDEFHLGQSFVDALHDHEKSPKLHLLGEYGRTQVTTQWPCVRVLRTKVDASTATRRPGQKRLNLGKLFAAYPNLESVSVSVNRLGGGSRPTAQIAPLELSEDTPFPPLRSLSLSGYDITREVSVWKERFPRDKLRSLSLGPQRNKDSLKHATGCVQGLTHFEITSYADNFYEPPKKLNTFLSSFETLESLTVKGYVPSLDAVAHHPGLKHLCLHAIERFDRQRPMLSVEEVESLDQRCPSITSLEIDVDPDYTWPEDFIKAIAKGFTNLRQLSVHVGLGIEDAWDVPEERDFFDIPLRKAFASVLTESTAQEFAKLFFKFRGSSIINTITLKTGEDLRWFPHWPPDYAVAEEECAMIIQIQSPRKVGDAPLVKTLEIDGDRMDRYSQDWNQERQPRLSRGPRIL